MAKYNPNSIWGGGQHGGAPFLKPDPKPEKKAEANPEPKIEQKAEPAKPKENIARNVDPSLFRSRQSSTALPLERPAFQVKNPWLWWLFGGAAIVIGTLAYIFFILHPGAGPSVGIQFSKPDQVLVGDPFTLTVSYLNTSNNILKNASLYVQLPQDVSFVGQNQGQRVMEQAIGDLGPNSLNKQDYTLIVTGSPSSIQHITAKITYGDNSQYESDGNLDLQVGDSAVGVNLSAPNNVFSGQDFVATVNYTNNTAKTLSNVTIQLHYPPAYTFKKSSVAPDLAGGNSWNIGTLKPGQTGSFTVTGNVVGPDDARYALEATVSANVGGGTYPVNDQVANLVVSASPLSVSIDLNGKGSGYIAGLQDSLNYTLTYTNNSDVTFRGITIKATLVGAMFNLASIHSDAALDSRTNTLTWYTANTPELVSLAPHQSGTVTFQVSTRNAFPIRLPSDKNYILKVNAEIDSPTVPSNTAGSGTMSVSSITSKVGGQLALAADGYWHDPSSGIVDSGPYPPRVNQTTQYTVHWRITNYSTDAQNVTVSAYLQSGTTYTGQVKSNVSSTPTYDSATGLLTWIIPSVPAGTGVITPTVDVAFQISNTPAINQVGQSVTLLSQTTLQAGDTFTGAQLQATAAPVTTDIPSDRGISIPQGNRQVTQ